MADERDWEAAARARLERTVAAAVARLRATADQIEREAAQNIKAAKERSHDWSSYGRVAGQVVHETMSALVNANFSNVIDAATDADKARAEKLARIEPDTGGPLSAPGRRGARRALKAMLDVLDGWVDGQQTNHVALEHRGENVGEECWTQFQPDDIRGMVNDAARQVRVAEVWTKEGEQR